MNKVILTGRLTKDIDLKKTSSGKDVANFSLAVKEGTAKTLFMNCTAWNNTATLMHQYLNKGALILIEGRLDKNKYTSANGNLVEDTIVVVDRVEFLESKSKFSEKG